MKPWNVTVDEKPYEVKLSGICTDYIWNCPGINAFTLLGQRRKR